MGQIDIAVGYSKKIESLLDEYYHAEGKGLHEKLSSVEESIDDFMIPQIRKIASIRNNVVHHEGYKIDNLDEFRQDCETVIEYLIEKIKEKYEKILKFEKAVKFDDKVLKNPIITQVIYREKPRKFNFIKFIFFTLPLFILLFLFCTLILGIFGPFVFLCILVIYYFLGKRKNNLVEKSSQAVELFD